jgi:hypothetical protein
MEYCGMLKICKKVEFLWIKKWHGVKKFDYLKCKREYKNRLRFDIVIKDWNNYNSMML